MKKLLFIVSLPVGAWVYFSLVQSVPGWVHIALGALGAGWWVCRYAWWRNWDRHKAAMRQARK